MSQSNSNLFQNLIIASFRFKMKFKITNISICYILIVGTFRIKMRSKLNEILTINTTFTPMFDFTYIDVWKFGIKNTANFLYQRRIFS